ncbi:FprA family A-type flavoprotein [bacterium]|nr:FprA family A-type flavoprotein [bacterium]
MNARKIVDGVHWVGALDPDRQFFDALIPLPEGTSYNAYVVQGADKTALIDTVEPAFLDVLIGRLASLGITNVDYIISNHAEQDHSGSLPDMLQRFPAAKIVCTPRCKNFEIDLLHLPEDAFVTVEDGDTLDLGGRTLEFIHAPFVHWPETMLTWLREDRILFPCDLFGSHYASSVMLAGDGAPVLGPAKRYYAEIMMPFAKMIVKHLKRLADYDIAMIAPSHGPVWDQPAVIIDAYRDWTAAEPGNKVLVPFVSMHGSTRELVDHLVENLAARGIEVVPFNLLYTDLGHLAVELVDAATIVIAAPTVLGDAHPLAAYAALVAKALKPKAKYAAILGSQSWGGKMADQLAGLLAPLKLEVLGTHVVNGKPRSDDFAKVEEIAQAIAAKHAEL